MDLGIKGRPALVLGGGGGLGRASAIALAREGALVAIADIDPAAVKASCEAVEAVGGRAHGIVWDLADIAAIDAHVTEVEKAFGPVQILVSYTGGPPPTLVSGQSADAWRKFFDMMVVSVIGVADRVVPGMRAVKWGRIVTSTSSGVVAPIPNLGLSNALRLSLVGWSKTLAREVAKDGITTNIIVPGRIATDRIRFLDEAKAKRENRSVDAVAAESVGTIPAGRYGNPEEYADAVAFLASDRASYITGTVMRVDGGLIGSV
ncbi:MULTISPECIES: SDR family oxidoreductase [unclassified Chelatococcus]|uniref:SDR family oxidoreductase n=1 Tax=unclassified Chelatococcus TaxID=2638111 RepID=UPI001BCEB1FF|nr:MULTISPECIES: SDR family oxidoreductase [unclassified Chelatococcus]CAH1671015.1 3-oxoacyl-ACP reductase [Hyphomicrobiales bacterium]MBS7739128.1 SDR family oxidoreductase [Chelatococcus sp. HY11]MBX3543618.1 SDR family oxidoreductase [Chelatococcus sp.]MCO5076340.1 SDR family oxidoreductase [Chelatococcus sp.]CAH1676780.1 3-oxoacyl-ACP reductase [Hyphomicrobiales bacterium]